jgi:hypothetical protein
MKRIIKAKLNKANEEVMKLYNAVGQLNDDGHSCFCDKREMYDFRNVTPVEETTIICLNCGGYVEYKEDDWL